MQYAAPRTTSNNIALGRCKRMKRRVLRSRYHVQPHDVQATQWKTRPVVAASPRPIPFRNRVVVFWVSQNRVVCSLLLRGSQSCGLVGFAKSCGMESFEVGLAIVVGVF